MVFFAALIKTDLYYWKTVIFDNLCFWVLSVAGSYFLIMIYLIKFEQYFQALRLLISYFDNLVLVILQDYVSII